MSKSSDRVVLDAQQVQELNHKLCVMRHDINNHLSLLIAAAELLRKKPQMADRMMETLKEQPTRISAALTKFSADFESAFGITQK